MNSMHFNKKTFALFEEKHVTLCTPRVDYSPDIRTNKRIVLQEYSV